MNQIWLVLLSKTFNAHLRVPLLGKIINYYKKILQFIVVFFSYNVGDLAHALEAANSLLEEWGANKLGRCLAKFI